MVRFWQVREVAVGPYDQQIAAEQAVTTMLYRRLDQLRSETHQRLDGVQRGRAGGSPQNRSERDSFAAHHQDRLAQLEAVEDRLYFGSVETDQGEKRLIGRLGLTGPDHTPLLTDWRAPAAEVFYQATPAHRQGVSRRRHVTTEGRRVTAVEDELLDTAAEVADTLSGEGALMAALAAGRTGRMGDIVATIQSEQDRIIRSDLAGALVVQGGPGTGKTAVALHRAAYLLYSHRERLAASGVLIVGPSKLFLRYIDRVLPSLGETGVVATTMAELIPGLSATATDQPAVARIKGQAVMAEVIRRAVRERQRLPRRDIELNVLGRDLRLRRRDIAAARSAARQTGKPHNQARATFVRELLSRLTDQLMAQAGDSLTGEDRAELTADLRSAPTVRTWINLCWMPLGPGQLLSDLLSKPHLLKHCAPGLSPAQRTALTRSPGAPWTTSDVPLLDEAAELLGEDQTAAEADRRHAAQARQQEVAYARAVLSMQGTTTVTAEQLADRFAAASPRLTIAEQASHDRAWTYGHIVVDEAQELSPMDWRCLLRRCPSRSLTVVGDAGQARAPGASGSWHQALDPALGKGRWRLQALSVNYRTPGAVVRAAQAMARQAGLPVGEDTAAREIDDALEVCWDQRPVTRAVALAAQLAPSGLRGRLAVVCASGDLAEVKASIRSSELAAKTAPDGTNPLDYPVAVLSADQTKGLEFDTVIVVEPGHIFTGQGPVEQRRMEAADLYVAMSRPTTKLVLVHRDALPPGCTSTL